MMNQSEKFVMTPKHALAGYGHLASGLLLEEVYVVEEFANPSYLTMTNDSLNQLYCYFLSAIEIRPVDKYNKP